jgi:cytochrome c553
VDSAYFQREVRPILEKSCLGCHGVGTQLSHFDLRSREAVLKGGTRGPGLVPGKARESLLYKMVSGIRGPQMPPGGKLPAAQVRTLQRWIDGGAPWSDDAISTAKEQVWWSFKAPSPPAVPAIKDAWIRNPIDAFVLQKLHASGLSPSPPAPRRALIRRAYLDLTGLPPTPEEAQAFEADRSPDAWEKVVDRLLASPHYGERWGRHWLDLVRYADSSGFEGDKDRPLAWRYRDYVINAFNQDKPYTEFMREQIAGDEIRPEDPQAWIATGYLACGPQDQVQKDAKTRADEMDDLVSTTGSVFLGLTVACARCHDHKYDPIKQTDYYRLSALFAPTERREVEVPTPEERKAAAARNAEVEAELAPLRAQAEPLRQRGLQAAKAAGQANPSEEQIAAALPEGERKQLAEIQGKIRAAEGKRVELPKALVVTDRGREFPPVNLLIRGDAYHPGPVVQPGFIVSLPGGASEVSPQAATTATTGRRRALAEWLAGPQNPLTARVWMNRVWRQHFGRGLVNTPSNFGLNGELPSHPELLDWLAHRFATGDGGQGTGNGPSPVSRPAQPWTLKPIHRLMLLSATYQQSSAVRETAMKADPQDRLYWRMPVRRLEAEAVRDSILAVAGSLNREVGGPPVYPPVDPTLRADTFQGYNWPEGEDSPKTWRRSVYVKVKRSLILPELEVFDCPEITASVAQRNITITPTQALTLLNDPLILRQAGLFAERVRKEAGPDPGKQGERAYLLAFGRPPTAREAALSLRFLEHRSLAEFCHSVFNLNEFVYAP